MITNVLTTNDRLRTICLAGDILPIEGSAECQSTALVNLFSESDQLLERWQKETKVMYNSDPSLPALLDELPKKQHLCVSRTLGATLSANNCSQARKYTSCMSQKMITTSKLLVSPTRKNFSITWATALFTSKMVYAMQWQLDLVGVLEMLLLMTFHHLHLTYESQASSWMSMGEYTHNIYI